MKIDLFLKFCLRAQLQLVNLRLFYPKNHVFNILHNHPYEKDINIIFCGFIAIDDDLVW